MRRASEGGGRLALSLGALLCLAGVSLFALGELWAWRQGQRLRDGVEAGLAAFREAQHQRSAAVALEIDALCQENAVFRTILSTASLADADLGFPGFHDPREALRDANHRLRSLLPALARAARADVFVVTNAQGQLLYSRAAPEQVGDDLSQVALVRETRETGSGVDVWSGPPDARAPLRLVPGEPAGALYEVIGRSVVFDQEVHGVVLMGAQLDPTALGEPPPGTELLLYAPGAPPLGALDPERASDLESRLAAAGHAPVGGERWRLAGQDTFVSSAPLAPGESELAAQVVALAPLPDLPQPLRAAALLIGLAGVVTLGAGVARRRSADGAAGADASQRYARAKELFLAAAARPASERGRYLDAAAAGDAELRKEVEALLDHSAGNATLAERAREAAPPRPQPERFEAGDVFAGRYRIVSSLGRGGMGEVYRADDLRLGVPVAIKLLRSDAAAPPEGLLNEVRLARQIAHPAVCRVYDVGEADGRDFFTMEYVEGEDLASHLARIGRLPAAKALELARELCGGLAAAHEQGVLHRDLKPANVMIDARGRARIVDFGIASRGPAQEEVLSGTPAYMAPEQLEPGGRTTERADLYALGLVLYEAVTGVRVFSARDLTELAAQRDRLAGDLRPPSELVPDVDPRLEAVILSALQPDPAERPASAREMARALGAEEAAGT